MEELGTSAASNSDTTDAVLEDGTYEVEFKTDSGMFHVNEANDGKGVLTVKDGQMSIHISLTSKNIVNLFVGKAQNDAHQDANLNISFSIKLKIVDELRQCLEDMGKTVTVNYF